jgi:hypothetical protein
MTGQEVPAPHAHLIEFGDGMVCSYSLVTPLEVQFIEQNGRRRAGALTPVHGNVPPVPVLRKKTDTGRGP